MNFEVDLADNIRTLGPLGDLNDKGRALTVNTVDRDMSAHKIDVFLNYGKTQAGSLDIAVAFLVHTLEGSEQMRDALLLDSYSRIGHGIDNRRHFIAVFLIVDLE